MFDDFETDDDLLDEDDFVAASAAGLLPPRETADISGHKEQEEFLLGLYNAGRMPHAIILAGPEGIGKSTFSFRLARFLLKNGKGGAAEEQAPSMFGDMLPPPPAPTSMQVPADDTVFRQVASGGHPDLIFAEVQMDEAKGKKKTGVNIETVRKIPGFMHMTASYGGWRIAIIDDADTMTIAAQNGVLKVMEEPPANALLILIAHRPGMFLPTIRSRCRTLNFKALSYEEFVSIVRKEDGTLKENDYRLLFEMTSGSPGRAIRILQEGGLESFETLMALLARWPKWSWPEVHGFADNLSKPGQEDAYDVFQETMLWLTQAMMRAKAQGVDLPPALARPPLTDMLAHYNLAQWIEICEQLTTHFETVQRSSLDKRQGVMGAFSLLSDIEGR